MMPLKEHQESNVMAVTNSVPRSVHHGEPVVGKYLLHKCMPYAHFGPDRAKSEERERESEPKRGKPAFLFTPTYSSRSKEQQ